MKGSYVQCDCGEWFLPDGRMGCSDECSDRFMRSWTRAIVDALFDPNGESVTVMGDEKMDELIDWATSEELFQCIIEKYNIPTITNNPEGKEVEYVYSKYGVAVVFTDNTCILVYEGTPVSQDETSYQSYIEFWSEKFPKAYREFMINFNEEEYRLFLRLKDKYVR
ncbi:hypothetical protein [Brevibacillus nitrificans]|uniref:hypothetical protein n=1 Tax=Brevibacillus nitrificans TaxID=651560 RepID=UPI00285E5A44|nr:hypothetical protein [Brevibacillus nitrificans]MDR7318940.1 hypothetical protein [Brevibacillus nitrificans]